MGSRWSKIRKAAVELPIELERYLHMRYPAFVTSPKPAPLREEVPVFMYHAVEQKTFAAQMEFLDRNGYQTLSLNQFLDFLCGRLPLNRPAVLLTFDDGEKSLYQVAFPILKQYGFQAAVFVVGATIRSEPDSTPGKGWLAWEELAEMEASGLVEVQSHSYYHAQIFCAPELIDFYHPGFDPSPLGLDIPWVEVDGQYTNRLEWGAPIYRSAPNLAGHRRYLDPLQAREACVQYTAQQGGPVFFERPHWRNELRQVFGKVFPHRHPGGYERPEALTERMRQDLWQSRTILEERLGHSVRHFCFPWGAGSLTALQLCREMGFLSAFWVISGHRRTNRPGDDSYTIQRIKDDYLLRLPGQGRSSLLDIYQAKLRRRSQTMDIY